MAQDTPPYDVFSLTGVSTSERELPFTMCERKEGRGTVKYSSSPVVIPKPVWVGDLLCVFESTFEIGLERDRRQASGHSLKVRAVTVIHN